MERLSSGSEQLLKSIIKERIDGKCNLDYWKNRFENLPFEEDLALRSQFKELKDNGYISCSWADNVPFKLVVLSKGLDYKSQKTKEYVKKVGSFMNSWLQVIVGALLGAIGGALLQKYFGILGGN